MHKPFSFSENLVFSFHCRRLLLNESLKGFLLSSSFKWREWLFWLPRVVKFGGGGFLNDGCSQVSKFWILFFGRAVKWWHFVWNLSFLLFFSLWLLILCILMMVSLVLVGYWGYIESSVESSWICIAISIVFWN